MEVSLDRKAGSRADVEASFESYDPLRDPEMRPTPYQAFVRIMIGCDKFCTYCIVPATRGKEVSRPLDEILDELEGDTGDVDQLAARVKEASELIRFCRERLAKFKAPRAVVFGELPKTSTGKIQKFVLREKAKSAAAIE